MIRTLVTGYGYWGEILTRNLIAHPDYFVMGVHDSSSERLAVARAANLYTFRTLTDGIDATTPDLVVIASPIGTIVPAALTSLNRHAHVMMAKPGATNSLDVDRIANTATRRRRFAFTDYTMMMSAEYHDLRQLAITGFDKVECVRNSVGSRSSGTIVEDMLVHDLAMICGFDREWFIASYNVSHSHVRVTLTDGRATAILSADRHAREPQRVMRLTSGDTVIEWDQMGPSMGMEPVAQRLTQVAWNIRNHGSDNRRLAAQVSALMEELA